MHEELLTGPLVDGVCSERGLGFCSERGLLVASVVVLFQGEQEARAEAVVLGCGAKGTSEGASATTTMATLKDRNERSNTLVVAG